MPHPEGAVPALGDPLCRRSMSGRTDSVNGVMSGSSSEPPSPCVGRIPPYWFAVAIRRVNILRVDRRIWFRRFRAGQRKASGMIVAAALLKYERTWKSGLGGVPGYAPRLPCLRRSLVSRERECDRRPQLILPPETLSPPGARAPAARPERDFTLPPGCRCCPF